MEAEEVKRELMNSSVRGELDAADEESEDSLDHIIVMNKHSNDLIRLNKD